MFLLLVLVCEVNSEIGAGKVIGHAGQSHITSPVQYKPRMSSHDHQVDTEVKLAPVQQQRSGKIPAIIRALYEDLSHRHLEKSPLLSWLTSVRYVQSV